MTSAASSLPIVGMADLPAFNPFQKLTKVVLALLGTSLICSLAHAAWVEGFENYSLGPIEGKGGWVALSEDKQVLSDGVEVVKDSKQAAVGTCFLKISDAGPRAYGIAHPLNESDLQMGHLLLYAQAKQTNTWFGFVLRGNRPGSPNDALVTFGFHDDGTFGYTEAGTPVSSKVKYEAGIWYIFDLHFNLARSQSDGPKGYSYNLKITSGNKTIITLEDIFLVGIASSLTELDLITSTSETGEFLVDEIRLEASK